MTPDKDSHALYDPTEGSEERRAEYEFKDDIKPLIETEAGLSEAVVRRISALKHEPDWMLDIRLQAYQEFRRLPLPDTGPDLSAISFDKLTFASSA